MGKKDTPNNTALNKSTLYVKGLHIIAICIKNGTELKANRAPEIQNMGITIKVWINPKDCMSFRRVLIVNPIPTIPILANKATGKTNNTRQIKLRSYPKDPIAILKPIIIPTCTSVCKAIPKVLPNISVLRLTGATNNSFMNPNILSRKIAIPPNIPVNNMTIAATPEAVKALGSIDVPSMLIEKDENPAPNTIKNSKPWANDDITLDLLL